MNAVRLHGGKERRSWCFEHLQFISCFIHTPNIFHSKKFLFSISAMCTSGERWKSERRKSNCLDKCVSWKMPIVFIFQLKLWSCVHKGKERLVINLSFSASFSRTFIVSPDLFFRLGFFVGFVTFRFYFLYSEILIRCTTFRGISIQCRNLLEQRS